MLRRIRERGSKGVAGRPEIKSTRGGSGQRKAEKRAKSPHREGEREREEAKEYTNRRDRERENDR